MWAAWSDDRVNPGPALLVVGHVNLDRIWELDAPLRAGARLQIRGRRLRLGGGGANTAVALAALGTHAVLAAQVARDAAGDAMLSWLMQSGVDTAGVERHSGTTVPSEILVDSAGERTLLGQPRAAFPTPDALRACHGGWAYINAGRLADPAALLSVCAHATVVAQMPLDPTISRPAQVLIASRSDIGNRPAVSLWDQRCAIDPMLCHLVITNGAAGVEIVGAEGLRGLPQPGLVIAGDTTGAGDFFAAGMLQSLCGGADICAAVAAGQRAAAALLRTRPPALAIWREVAGID